MNAVSFFTPIAYSYPLKIPLPVSIKLLALVDSLLPNLQGGKQAEIYSTPLDRRHPRCYLVHLVERNSSVWVAILKIVFFTTFRSVAVFFLITKIILRCHYSFFFKPGNKILKIKKE